MPLFFLHFGSGGLIPSHRRGRNTPMIPTVIGTGSVKWLQIPTKLNPGNPAPMAMAAGLNSVVRKSGQQGLDFPVNQA